MKHLGICLPQTDTVRREYSQSLASMMLRIGNVDAGVRQVRTHYATGSVLCSLRQMLAERAIEQGATHLLWIDADHTFPDDMAHRLLAHDRPWVGINATTRIQPIRATAQRKRGEPLETTQHSKGLEKVWRMGFGIAMIEARVFEAMPKPWFLIEYVETDDGPHFRGEDIYFCEKAKAAGFHPMVDQDLTKETAHIGSFPVSWESAVRIEESEAQLERVA